MRAAVMQGLHAPLIVRELPDLRPGPSQVLIRVHHCGICGSDLHMTEDPIFGKGHGDVLGHEFAGEILECGKDVERLAVGDRVAVVPLESCGHCAACRGGEPAWCASMRLQGGGYAEQALTGANQCMRLPAGLSSADGAITEPLGIALHGVVLSGLKPGDNVLILGAGPIGLAVAYWARRMGARTVVVQDIALHQQERAMAMGASHFLCDRDEPVAASDRVFDGKPDIVFECVGAPGLIAQAVDQVRNRGVVLILGLCTQPDSFVPFVALSKEVRLVTSVFFSLTEYQAAIDALDSGGAEPRALITNTVGLDETPQMFESLKARTGQCKVLIAP
jgi:(R,R)-butanediol dehydrogenase/meso-butanediol dehydrogenase/diacetyl reductase